MIMSLKKFAAFALSTTLLLSACGSDRDLASGSLAANLSSGLNSGLNTDAALPGSLGSGVGSSNTDSEIAAAIPKILKGIEDLRQEIRALDIRSSDDDEAVSSSSTGGTKTPTSTKTPTRAPSSTPPRASSGGTKTPAAKPTAAPPKESNTDKGKVALANIVSKYSKAQFVQLTAEKIEKNLATGKVSTNVIDMSSKAPNLVRIDILESSAGSSGVSAVYTSGVGDKIKIKKLFIKLDLDKTDERVTSGNGYLADKIDMVGLIGRLSNGYSAELVGTTTVAGKKVNILKVETTGTNTLDDRITYEYLGYEPDTFSVRLWELYNGEKDPYFRMVLKKMEFPATISDKTFSL
jgi:hypothetical protein